MTQAKTVMEHLKRRGSLTAAVASGMYGIGRLAAVVHRINRDASEPVVKATRKRGLRASYVEYTLAEVA